MSQHKVPVFSCTPTHDGSSVRCTNSNQTHLPPTSPHTQNETLDPSSLTPEQIDADNEHYYNLSSSNTTQHTSSNIEGNNKKAGPHLTDAQPPRIMISIPTSSNAYTFRRLPGGGRIITCPDDVFIKSMTPTRAVFKIKKRRSSRG